jgi:CubicO group peptidase (beta-lactamase class C family)
MRIFCAAFLLAAFLTTSPLCAQPARPPLGAWERATPAEMGMDEFRLARAREYALKGGGSGMVIHRGKLVYSWGDPKAKYDLKSSTKSIGVTALGLALKDGKVRLSDPAAKHFPEFGAPPEENRASGWLQEITLMHLAAQTAGFDKPGGFQPLLFRPGAKWAYSDGGPNWLADCLTLAYKRDLQDLLFDRVFTPLGITREDLHWRENAYRPKTLHGIPRREFGSGVHANVDAMARIGFLYLRAGRIRSGQVLPSDFVALARQPLAAAKGIQVVAAESYPDASNHYGLLWWNNGDGSLAKVPRDAYWSWGLYDSLIVVVPSLDLVVARAGKSIDDSRGASYSRLQPFLEPIALAVDPVRIQLKPPYPPSPVIAGIEWDAVGTIRRQGSDCDNFPASWADDGDLYVAHGDCRGFFPLRPHKLGLGFVRIAGGPADFQGVNVPSDADNTGEGAKGKKGSGLLMVDGVLYLWARNAGNSQLAWSTDYAKTWTWADWKFITSFGHPTFLNFGRNYAGARDEYVYIYSPDHDSAYEQAAGLVMARVHRSRIRERGAYEFFRFLGRSGKPVWTKDIAQRGNVFSNPPAGVYRTQVSFNAGLKRYFLNHILIGSDHVRFQGGFGIYDAPEPWGPWTTVEYTPTWDVGPGENQHFPPKWMSADGRTMHLIFSGDDVFSVRKATLRLR